MRVLPLASLEEGWERREREREKGISYREGGEGGEREGGEGGEREKGEGREREKGEGGEREKGERDR